MRRVWVIRGGEEVDLVDDFVAGGDIGLHYPDLPDGQSIDLYDITERLRARGWTNPEARAELFQLFVHQVRAGHLVVMPDPARRDVVIGRIEGDYEFRYDLSPDDHRHRRAVTWLARHGTEQLPDGCRDLSRQRAALAERSTPALVAHVESVERGELGRAPADTSRPVSVPRSSSPRAPRPSKAAAAPKAPTVETRRCAECFLAKPADLFPGGGEVCVDCG